VLLPLIVVAGVANLNRTFWVAACAGVIVKQREAELSAAYHAADTGGAGTRVRSVVRPKSC
jgi:hypothetical protein